MQIEKRFTGEDYDNFTRRFENIIKCLHLAGMTFEADLNSRQLFFDMAGDSSSAFHLTLALDPSAKLLEVAVLSDEISVPVERRYEIAEFCVRANHRLNRGKLDFDFDDGEVRSHASEFIEEDDIARSLFRGIATALNILDIHYLAIMEVINAQDEPKAALSRVF